MGSGPALTAHATFDITQFIWLLLIASIIAMMGRRLRIPYAVALVITGLVIGAPRLLPHARLDPHTLFTVFLPPLLFESAINLRMELLRRNWQPIALYALGGTLLSTFIVGGLVAWAFSLPMSVALVFGALISATDPISVLAVFKQLGVDKRLSLIVEAESLFNDGVAIVLFGILVNVALGGTVSIAAGVQQFVVVVAGGVCVGLSIGVLGSRITRKLDDHLLEIMLTTVIAFGSYLCAEAAHISGVIAVVTAGLVVGNYGMQTGMSPTTRLAVSSFWEYAAFAVNSIVFLLLGIEVTVVNLWDKVGIVLGAACIVLLGRAAAVYALSPVMNWRKGGLRLIQQHVLFWGGLRGALPMALAMGLGQKFPQRDTLMVLTFGVVLCSLLGQGLTIGALLRRLGLTGRKSKASEYQLLSGESLAARAALAELERLFVQGIVPRGTCESLVKEYRERLEGLEKRIAELHMGDDILKERQIDEARRLALLAEKHALQEAERNGLLDREEIRDLEERIDALLAELQAKTEDE